MKKCILAVVFFVSSLCAVESEQSGEESLLLASDQEHNPSVFALIMKEYLPNRDPVKRKRDSDLLDEMRKRRALTCFFEDFDVSPETIRNFDAIRLAWISESRPNARAAFEAILLLRDGNLEAALNKLHDPKGLIYTTIEKRFFDEVKTRQIRLHPEQVERYINHIAMNPGYHHDFRKSVCLYLCDLVKERNPELNGVWVRTCLETIATQNQDQDLRRTAVKSLMIAARYGLYGFNAETGLNYINGALSNSDSIIQLEAVLQRLYAAREGDLGFDAISGRNHLEAALLHPDSAIKLEAANHLFSAVRMGRFGIDVSWRRTYIEQFLSNTDLTIRSAAADCLLNSMNEGNLGFNAENSRSLLQVIIDCNDFNERIRLAAAQKLFEFSRPSIRTSDAVAGYNSLIREFVDNACYPDYIRLAAAQKLFEFSRSSIRNPDAVAGYNSLIREFVDNACYPDYIRFAAAQKLFEFSRSSIRNPDDVAAYDSLIWAFVDNACYPDYIRLEALGIIDISDEHESICDLILDEAYPVEIRLRACERYFFEFLEGKQFSADEDEDDVRSFLEDVINDESYPEETRLKAADILFLVACDEQLGFDRENGMRFIEEAMTNRSYPDRIRLNAAEMLFGQAILNLLGFNEESRRQLFKRIMTDTSYLDEIRLKAAEMLFEDDRIWNTGETGFMKLKNNFESIVINPREHSKSFRLSLLEVIIDSDMLDTGDEFINRKKTYLLDLYKNVWLTSEMRDLICEELRNKDGYQLTPSEYTYMLFIDVLMA